MFSSCMSMPSIKGFGVTPSSSVPDTQPASIYTPGPYPVPTLSPSYKKNNIYPTPIFTTVAYPLFNLTPVLPLPVGWVSMQQLLRPEQITSLRAVAGCALEIYNTQDYKIHKFLNKENFEYNREVLIPLLQTQNTRNKKQVRLKSAAANPYEILINYLKALQVLFILNECIACQNNRPALPQTFYDIYSAEDLLPERYKRVDFPFATLIPRIKSLWDPIRGHANLSVSYSIPTYSNYGNITITNGYPTSITITGNVTLNHTGMIYGGVWYSAGQPNPQPVVDIVSRRAWNVLYKSCFVTRAHSPAVIKPDESQVLHRRSGKALIYHLKYMSGLTPEKCNTTFYFDKVVRTKILEFLNPVTATAEAAIKARLAAT